MAVPIDTRSALTPWIITHERQSTSAEFVQERVFERSLGYVELAFYWNGAFAGATDSVQHFSVHYPPSHPITQKHVEDAWVALKRIHPLLGAYVVELDAGRSAKYVVDEARLASLSPNELSYVARPAPDALQNTIEAALNGRRKLSRTLLSSIVAIQRQDELVVDFVVSLAHTISDAMAIIALVPPFVGLLSSGKKAMSIDIKQRLDLAVPPQRVFPQGQSFSLARRRWRQATALIILRNQLRRISGGHTLPCTLSTSTPLTPAISKLYEVTVAKETTRIIMESCRKHSLTFGHAFPVLSQIALSRLLHRRYRRGEITGEEWRYRLIQPTHTAGPLNLRPFLSREWQEAGGQATVNVCLSSYSITLPFMPHVSDTSVVDVTGAPPFRHLLSHKRFIARAQDVKQQMNRMFSHPLFLEIATQRGPSDQGRDRAILWRQSEAGEVPPMQRGDPVPVMSGKPVMFHGGSTVGNVQGKWPNAFPISWGDQSTSETNLPPTMTLESGLTQARCRPAQLYLSAWTLDGRLNFTSFYDANVYRTEIVREWVNEMQAATEWYLGGTGPVSGRRHPDKAAKL